MVNIFKSKKVVELESEVKRLNQRVTEVIEDRDNSDLRLLRSNIEHSTEVESIKIRHNAEISRLQTEIKILENSIKDKIAAGIASELRRLKNESQIQDKKHADRMAKLEKDYAEKIARCDSKLESDKASYKKYLRTENNNLIDSLTKENKKLAEEVSELRGVNTAVVGMNGTLTGQLDSTVNLMNGLIKALPTISAEFSTPDVSAPNVTVGSGNKS